jgi:hypothetical protein
MRLPQAGRAVVDVQLDDSSLSSIANCRQRAAAEHRSCKLEFHRPVWPALRKLQSCFLARSVSGLASILYRGPTLRIEETSMPGASLPTIEVPPVFSFDGGPNVRS